MSIEVQSRLDNLAWSLATVLFIIASSAAVAYLARWVARLRGLSVSEQRKIFWGFLFASPWIVGFIIWVVGPALASFYYSFTDYKLGGNAEWIGLGNYQRLLLGEGSVGRRFKEAMFNSFYYAAIGVPLQIGAALGMALLLNQKIRGIRIFRLIFYLPVILAGGPALLLAWRYLLASNGGFVNEILRRIASSFFVFDFLYRLFIYVVESFNGFYTGLVRGDPIGPFKYTLPALLGALILLTLVRGEWSESKRSRAWRMVEIVGIALAGVLFARGMVSEPIDVSWTYIGGIAALAGVMVSIWRGRIALARVIQFSTLALVAAGLVSTLVQTNAGDGIHYVIGMALVGAALLASLFGQWERRKYMALGGAVAIFCAVVFARAIPGQLDGGRLAILGRYLTFQTALENPGDLDYLDEVYPTATMSTLWIYGLVVGVMGGLAILNNRYPRAQRILMYGALAFFALLTIGSFLDGQRYFRAYEDIAQATDTQNFHFARFQEATAEFPGQDRVPLWMTNELWSKPSLILITMWSSGAGMLIFLAALKGVPQVFYESAEVDGANRFQKFFKITLPIISPALFYNLVIGVIAALQTFESIYILRRPENEDSLASAAYFLFVRTFQEQQIGQGAAVSWILVVIIVALTALQFRYSRWVHYEA